MNLYRLFFILLGSSYILNTDLAQCSQFSPQEPADYQCVERPEPIVEMPPLSTLFDLEALSQDFILETKKIEVPDHPFAFNPSIVRWKGSMLMSFRSYKQQSNSTNPFGVVWLNDNFEPVGTPQIFELPFNNPILFSKQQDPRLIAVNNRMFILYNNILENVTHREMRRMFIVELFCDDQGVFTTSDPECLEHFEGENDNRYEKNWVPFEYNDELLLSYSIIPHRILRPVLGTNLCVTLENTKKPFKWDWGVPRGGTQAMRDGDHYIAFFHSWIDTPTLQTEGRKITHYIMGAYTFEAKPPFALIATSSDPIVANNFYAPPFYKTWKPLRCVFPAGLLLDKDHIWVSYGRQDHECWVMKIDKQKLLNSLTPVSAGP